MTPSEIKKLVRTLRACGITHYKEGGLELDLGPVPPKEKRDEANGEIPHGVEELVSVMKLGDKELIERLFPEPKEEDNEL